MTFPPYKPPKPMQPHHELIENFKAIINDTPHGAIIILSEKTGGVCDMECTSNLTLANQITVLRELLRRLEARPAT